MDIKKYLKDLFGGKKTETSTTDFTDVYEQINNITADKNLPDRPDLGEAKTYERMEYTPLTDDQISASAAASLAEYRSNSVSGIENEIAALLTKFSEDKAANSEAYERTIRSLGDAYRSAVETANNDALKRGLARSSVAAATTAQLSSEHAARVSEAATEHENKKADIDDKVRELEVKRQRALDDFNVAYTAKLTDEINKLKSERDENMREVTEYNNSLAKRENDEALERAELESKLYSEALKHESEERSMRTDLTEAEKDAQYQAIYNVLRDRLLTMSAKDARDAVLSNDLFNKYLSSAYYYKLYDEFGR